EVIVTDGHAERRLELGEIESQRVTLGGADRPVDAELLHEKWRVAAGSDHIAVGGETIAAALHGRHLALTHLDSGDGRSEAEVDAARARVIRESDSELVGVADLI